MSEPLNVPLSLKVDKATAHMIARQKGNLHTGQFVRLVLRDALKLRASARSGRLESLVRPSPGGSGAEDRGS